MVVKLAFLQCRGLTLRIYIHGCEVSVSSMLLYLIPVNLNG